MKKEAPEPLGRGLDFCRGERQYGDTKTQGQTITGGADSQDLHKARLENWRKRESLISVFTLATLCAGLGA